jgi:hypothetical protein
MDTVVLKCECIRPGNAFVANLEAHSANVEKIIKIDPRVIKLLMIENSEFGFPPRACSARFETAWPPAETAPLRVVTSSVGRNGKGCIDAGVDDS